MKIIEYGRPIDGIPYPVELWNADYHMWDDSIEELTHRIYAESEDGAIEAAKDFMLDVVHAFDMNEEERAGAIDYYGSENVYRIASVNIDAIDFKRSDIERIERAALACQRKAACYGLEEIAILFTLLPGLSAQHGPQLAVGVWLGGFNDQVGLP